MKYFDEYATFDVNKEKYKKLSLRHHPDRPGGSNKAMAEINGEWDEAQVKYKLGHLPRTKSPIPKGRNALAPFRAGGEQLYSMVYNKVKYTGTKEEIILKVMDDFGPQAALQVMAADVMGSIIKDIFK